MNNIIHDMFNVFIVFYSKSILLNKYKRINKYKKLEIDGYK